MAEVILVCECGMRLRAPGAAPGRVGRCPRCGGRLRVPDELRSIGAERPGENGGDSSGGGYQLAPGLPEPPTAFRRARSRCREPGPGGAASELSRSGKKSAMADGFLPALEQPETNWFASFLYPLRGAESLGVIAGLSLVSWIFFQLVPEYCLTLLRDAESMGAGILGWLFILVCGVPVLILSPLVVSYWLQYLGRVLVSSAMGETTPPRSPDRNFDGFLTGLSPWFVWLILGLGVGWLPMAWYLSSPSGTTDVNPWIVVVLALAGFPYLLAALMMTFLHDDPLAAKPWRVVQGLARLGVPFWALVALIGATIGLSLGSFALALLIRPHAFWPYLLVGLACWMILHGMVIVVMRLLGTYYFHHQDDLKWHREHPRWGVAWRL